MTQNSPSTPARHMMREPKAIRERLRADLVKVAAERGGVEKWHLLDLGWTSNQLAAHLDAAIALPTKLAA